MLYVNTSTFNDFALPLLELSNILNHGYLFKLTSDYSSENFSYQIITVVSENDRYSKFNHNFDLVAGQYKCEVFEYDLTNRPPTTEIGLKLLSTSILIIKETQPNGIYS